MLIDSKGVSVRLGPKLGRSGGEGNAYTVESHRGLVAKIYHRVPTPEKVAKLAFLTQRSTPEVQKCSAWPMLTISDDGQGVRGFLMPMVSGKEIHQLFGPRERVVEFPGKNWDFLVNTARNCAAAFNAVHVTGAVIGDVNEGNILVQTNGIVSLIDCDSYQVSNGSMSWTCDVGVSLWTPPELQGRDFKGLVRTPNHDLFGLALMIFKLLFLGRHPFAGIQSNGSDYLLEDAIRNRLYAYSRNAQTFGVRTPPFTFPVAALSEPYTSMFERAFRLEVSRPTAQEWVSALEALQQSLTHCSRDSCHKFPKSLTTCPWCEIAAAGGPLFFINVQVTYGAFAADNAHAVWAAISRIEIMPLRAKSPNDFKSVPSTPTALPANASGTKPVFVVGWVLAIIACLLLVSSAIWPAMIVGAFALGMIFEGRRTAEFIEEKDRRKSTLASSEAEIASVSSQLDAVLKNYQTTFVAKKTELKSAYERYSGIDRERALDLQKLESNKQQLQLNAFLRAQLISQASIPGIGQTRKRRLLSFGIGSALDIRPDLQIPGFGPTNLSHLINWRRLCETRFRFQPAQPVPAIEIQRLNLKFATLRNELWSRLQSGPASLTTLSAGAQGRFLQLQAQLENALRRRSQAEVDYEAC